MENKRVVFDGDGYSEEWHQEAENRGLPILKTTPDALPCYQADDDRPGVREVRRAVRARARVALRGAPRAVHHDLNIEAETAASIARTMILPAAIRHLNELKLAGIEALVNETGDLVDDLTAARSSRSRRSTPTTLTTRHARRGEVHARHGDPGDARGARRSRTSSRRSWPTTCGRYRSTRRCCSSSSPSGTGHVVRKPRYGGAFVISGNFSVAADRPALAAARASSRQCTPVVRFIYGELSSDLAGVLLPREKLPEYAPHHTAKHGLLRHYMNAWLPKLGFTNTASSSSTHSPARVATATEASAHRSSSSTRTLVGAITAASRRRRISCSWSRASASRAIFGQRSTRSIFGVRRST